MTDGGFGFAGGRSCREGFYAPPIRINLRTDELRITHQLIGIGLLPSGVDATPFTHSPRDDRNHAFEGHLANEGKA